jgi:hypothetical protein
MLQQNFGRAPDRRAATSVRAQRQAHTEDPPRPQTSIHSIDVTCRTMATTSLSSLLDDRQTTPDALIV